jgi:murein DD-endopeptidase MepM/ murein hydrolase activator NlpD
MLATRYHITITNPATGKARQFRMSPRGLLGAAALLMALPILIGLGARWSGIEELGLLRQTNQALVVENDSFRAATGELTDQIASLQAVVDELGSSSAFDPQSAAAMARLPAAVRNRAMGGSTASTQALQALTLAAAQSPENTFGVLRDVLVTLERRLRLVRTDVEPFEALASATPSIWPLVGWLSDGFGRRQDPFSGEAGYHLGLDIASEPGRPVRATADGRVQNASYSGDYGNLVVLEHDFGLVTRYAHLSRMAVKRGGQVKRGEVIGYVGSTGRATGPHLHYEVWANGKPINPLHLLTRNPRR